MRFELIIALSCCHPAATASVHLETWLKGASTKYSHCANITGQVEAALALAAAVLQGGELSSALQAVAAHLAAEATRLQLQQPASAW